MDCAACGRRLRFPTSPVAGRCRNDKCFQCTHCATLFPKCRFCSYRLSSGARTWMLGGIFIGVLMGLVLGPTILVQGATNARLDSLPTTPLAEVQPGTAYKVFATVGPNQSNVIVGTYGYSGNGLSEWQWKAHDFWITDGSTRLFVSTGAITSVRQPGNPWGTLDDSVSYSAGNPISLYGTTIVSANGTTLVASYISQSPTTMGVAGGEVWPFAAGILVVAAAFSSITAVYAFRQTRQHLSFVLAHPPRLPAVHLPPSVLTGEVTRFDNDQLGRLSRNSWVQTAATITSLVIGVLVFLDVYYFLGIFFISFGAVFLFASIRNRRSYARSPRAVIMSSEGVTIVPVVASVYREDSYFPWSAIESFRAYFGQLLALRTDRGEFILHNLDRATNAGIAAFLQANGIPSDEPAVVNSLGGSAPRLFPLRPLAPHEWQSRLGSGGLRSRYSLLVMTMTIVAVVVIPFGLIILPTSAPVGLGAIALGACLSVAAGVFYLRWKRLLTTVMPGDEPVIVGRTSFPGLPPQEGTGLGPLPPPPPAPSEATPHFPPDSSGMPTVTGVLRPPPPPPPPYEVRVNPVPDYFGVGPVSMPGVFPRGLILPGESVVYEIRPRIWKLFWPHFVVLGVAMAIFLAPVGSPGYAANPFLYVFEGILALAALALVLVGRHTAYAITTQRVLVCRGRRGTQGHELPLDRLAQVSLDGLMSGTITFHSNPSPLGRISGIAGKVRWRGTPNPPGLYGYLRRTLPMNPAS